MIERGYDQEALVLWPGLQDLAVQKGHLVQNTPVPKRLAQACGRHPVA